jgi:hypothetical protein
MLETPHGYFIELSRLSHAPLILRADNLGYTDSARRCAMRDQTILLYEEWTTRAGRVLVVMSQLGVVDVVLAEHAVSPAELVASVQSRFPDAVLVPDRGVHGLWAAAAVARIDGSHTDFAAPIDFGWAAPFSTVGAHAPGEYEQAL